MKLKRLYLGDYRVLRDLEIRFCPPTERRLTFTRNYSLDFLVGVNGTGKSTVLKILWNLMQQLEGNPYIEYPFELEYELGTDNQKRTIKISNRHEDPETEEMIFTPVPSALENNQPIAISRDILPELVVAFTTGSEGEWDLGGDQKSFDSGNLAELQDLSQLERAIRELPGKRTNLEITEGRNTSEGSRCLFIKNHQLPLLTLCSLLVDLAENSDQSGLKDVFQEVYIKPISGFSLKFRKTHDPAYLGDWDDVKSLARIASLCLHQGNDYLLVFDLTSTGHSIAKEIFNSFSSGLELFKKLSLLANVDENGQSVLREVNIFLERTNSPHPETHLDVPPLHLFEWLSDGERSFLGRMSLFTLLGTTEALIILDEPEVHFNDFWKRQIVQLLDAKLKDRHSHVLITTHSSITLTDVPKEDIVVLDRNGNYTQSSFNPTLRTFGADPSDIMVHVFGAPHPAGASSVHRIEQELENSLNRSPHERREVLEELLNNVVAQGYWSYLIRRELQTMEKE
ncbi:MAG: AAA family ATPase [Coleofasciculus sp. B1-GNL1-01]|uniref:AAA family ATPase n=1 Tax=Coleofasciculus sp. B1-GNL1-01 TaxID=3068484 RepID=UPI0032F3EDA3